MVDTVILPTIISVKLEQRKVKNLPKVLEIVLGRVKIPTQNSLHTFNCNIVLKATLVKAIDTNACKRQLDKPSRQL